MRPTVLSPNAKSPRGVADVFLQVDKKEKLNGSFSWADNSSSTLINASSPTKKSSTTRKVRIKSEKSWDGKKDKKVTKEKKLKSALKGAPAPFLSKPKKSLPSVTAEGIEKVADPAAYKVEILKAALEKTAEQLKQVNELRKKDAEDIQAALRQAKKECREEMEKIFKPVIDSHRKDGKSHNKKQEETAKLIQYLKDDNAKIRKEIESYARKIKEIKQSNDKLERCNHHADQAYAELEDQVETMKAVNEKLNSNVVIFKDMLKKMKKDYKKRTLFHQVETNCSGYYETCTNKVVKSVSDRSRHPDFIEDIYTIASEGIATAKEEREKHSPSCGLQDLPSPQKPHGKDKTSWSFMFEKDESGENEVNYSDSDDDSDDEN